MTAPNQLGPDRLTWLTRPKCTSKPSLYQVDDGDDGDDNCDNSDFDSDYDDEPYGNNEDGDVNVCWL